MKIKFKNTYKVFALMINGRSIDVDLSDYDTFDDFTNYLKSQRISFKRINHDDTYWEMSEMDYSALADWHHSELEDYMNKHLSKNWSEDAESCWFANGLTLEEMFNQLKQIDGVELELEVEVEPGDYINKYEGPDHYGKAWEKIKKIIDKPVKQSTSKSMKSLANYIDDQNDGDFVDWNAACDDAIKNGYFKSYRR